MYDAEDKVYCYPKTNVLKNKLNIKDGQLLDLIEREYTDAKAIILENRINEGSIIDLIQKPMTSQCLKDIHHFLFSDIYDFAGQLRKVKIAKGVTTFCYPEHIEHEMDRLFHNLKNEDYLAPYSEHEFLDRLSFYLTELNMVHPFREGNGRVLRIFSNILATNNGYYVNYHEAKNQYLDVMIKSIIDNSYLTALLNQCMIKL